MLRDKTDLLTGMKNFKIKITVITIWFLVSILFILNCSTKNETLLAQTKTNQVKVQVKEVENYRNWTKVNSTPHLMPDIVARSCVLYKSSDGEIVDSKTNPHLDKFITVYVNDIGREAMLKQKIPKFPEGSVIVKEKLPTIESQTPELLTIMIKQKEGYNPENGDWEYMVTNGGGTEIEGRGNLANCQACHFNKERTDYIFRTYLSKAQYKKLN